MLKLWLKAFVSSRLWALSQKELRQILRDRQLLFLLMFPPTIQLFIFGFALNPEVTHLRLAVLDLSNSPTSRELVSALVENHVFDLWRVGTTYRQVTEAVCDGKVEAGLIIPPEFNREIKQGRQARVQVLLDGVDANKAGIAGGYVSQIFTAFSRRLETGASSPIELDASFLYNPGLISAWFFVPGVMGLVLNLTGSLVSSSALVREKDSGTLEQLLMTPAASWEILMAKIVPLFIVLNITVLLALSMGALIFQVPFRGNFLFYMAISALYIFVAISIGLMLATIARNQRQVVMTSFFFNLPIIQLSGAVAPVASMPLFFQYLSLLNPLRYYVACIRAVLLRGVGLEVLWPNVLALFAFAAVLLLASAHQFRRQLG